MFSRRSDKYLQNPSLLTSGYFLNHSNIMSKSQNPDPDFRLKFLDNKVHFYTKNKSCQRTTKRTELEPDFHSDGGDERLLFRCMCLPSTVELQWLEH